MTNQNYYQQTRALESILGEHIRFGQITASLIVDVAPPIAEEYKKRQHRSQVPFSSTMWNTGASNDKQKSNNITLLDCFKLFTRREVLSNDDLWRCPRCNGMKRASRKVDLWLLPKVLIVQLKRFNYTGDGRGKIDLLIDCPLRELDLSEFVLNPDEKPKAKYDLIAVSNHMGGLGGGHYTAYAKNSRDQKWHTFDDSYVCDTREDSVISKGSYILVYQQQGRF